MPWSILYLRTLVCKLYYMIIYSLKCTLNIFEGNLFVITWELDLMFFVKPPQPTFLTMVKSTFWPLLLHLIVI